MKNPLNKEDMTKTLCYSIAICSGVLLYFLITFIPSALGVLGTFMSILNPFIYAIVIAFLLSRPVAFFEKLLKKYIIKKESKHGVRRVLSIVITYVLALGIFSLLLSIIIPQLVLSVSSLIAMIPSDPSNFKLSPELIQVVKNMIDTLHLSSDVLLKIESFLTDSAAQIISFIGSWVPGAINMITGIAGQFYNVFFGMLLSFYLLGSKEKYVAQCKKICTAALPKQACRRVLELGSLTNNIFGKYMTGQLIDACVIGTLCFIGMTLLKMPYALLISVIVCITNVIPMVGPFIGAIPGIFILLVSANPMNALWFGIFIIVLQQLDGNLFAPLIVGGSTGISGFWTMFAVLVGGSLWGIAGIIVSVPTFTVLYIVISRVTAKILRHKNLPDQTSAYNTSKIPLK